VGLPAGPAGALHLYPARLRQRKWRGWRLGTQSGTVEDMASNAGSIPRGRMLEILTHLPNFLRLYWRLFRDRRVSIWPKAMLVAALVYVVLPFDLIPDFIFGIGEIDDLVVVLLAARWFIAWCPPDVVQEHARAIDAGRRG
jgi:uncharacterized membrane protein YkvA (DUF1232 family)